MLKSTKQLKNLFHYRENNKFLRIALKLSIETFHAPNDLCELTII